MSWRKTERKREREGGRRGRKRDSEVHRRGRVPIVTVALTYNAYIYMGND